MTPTASWGKRLLALMADWTASSLVAYLISGWMSLSRNDSTFLPLLVFFVEVTLFTALLGGSFGQLVFRVQVVRMDGSPVSLLRAALRTLLICLVIPPLVFDSRGRGLHDMAAGTTTSPR